MIHRAFLLALALPLAAPAHAAKWQSHEALKQQVHSFIEQQLQAERMQPLSPERFQIHVNNLDGRLRLAECEDKLELAVTSPPPIGHQVTTRVSCIGETPWTIYLPVRIDLFAEVSVASRNLERGQVITEADVEVRLMNIAQAGNGFTEDTERLVGMTLKRPLRAGETLRLSHLQPTKVVARGDKVVVEARSNGLTVVAEGSALAAGHVGEQIRVRNLQSNRVVSATVVAAGRVEIVY